MLFSFVLFFCGYLFGAIPFGLVLCYLAGYGDVRKIGSGNIGATNVLRTGNKFLAFLTLILDAGKGALPIGIYLWMNNFVAQPVDALTIGLGAIAGHNFSIWLKFKGGKGIATTFGTLLAAVPMVGMVACLSWVTVATAIKLSSLAALVALLVAPVAAYAFYGLMPAILTLAIAILGFIRHKDNIKRLIKGEEPKIGAGK